MRSNASHIIHAVQSAASGWYGVTILVRKRWLQDNGFGRLTATVVPWPTSQGRALLVLEFIGDLHDIAVLLGDFPTGNGTPRIVHENKSPHRVAGL